MSVRLGISMCGAVALVVLARAGAYYARADALALGLVAIMTVALTGALAELLARVGHVERLERELAALPRDATTETIDGASDALRPLLRARVEQVASSAGGAPLAGYVVGLLVMLGLLGTFLGLFETLRGAREALVNNGGDVDALRAGLAAPMQGLTRSFGTSAAGVSSSAMLGLAVALARKADARFARALASYATVALAPHTVQGRQLAALERIALQGEATPRIVAALEGAVARLGALEGAWAAAHVEATRQTSAAIREGVERVGADAQRAVAQAIAGAEQTLLPLVTRAVEGSVAAAKTHVAELGARLDEDLAARRREDAAHARAMEEARARGVAADEARAQALGDLWSDATGALAVAVAGIDARGVERDALFAKATRELTERAGGALDAAERHLGQVDARAVAQASRLEGVIAAIDAREEAAAERATALRGALDALLVDASARARELDAQVRGGLASLVTEVQRGLVDQTARAEAFAALSREAHARLVAEVEGGLAAQAATADALGGEVRSHHASLAAGIQRGIEAHAERAASLERDVGLALSSHAEKLVAAMVANAGAREAELEAVAGSVREAAAGMQAGSAELAAVAEMFAAAVDRHREGAASWLEALGTVEGAIARAGDDAAGGAMAEQLDRARELFDAQLQFHRELLMQVRGQPPAPAPRRERQDEDAPA